MNYKAIIKQKFGLDDYDYGNMVYVNGLKWIKNYFGLDAIMVSTIEESKSFWKWWINQWDNRDAIFIQNNPQMIMFEKPFDGSLKWFSMESYATAHQFDKLKIYPNRMVVEEVSRMLKAKEKDISSMYVTSQANETHGNK